jgi:signal transduction histidine kinase
MKQTVAKILVVEDDPFIAELILLILDDPQYSDQQIEANAQYLAQHVETAADAFTALESSKFDLIILDWMLPDMEGDQICRAIKARYASVFLPVLMLTARNTLADRIAGLNAGADDFLSKPFNANELMARVRALLRIRAAELERVEALAALDCQHNELRKAYDQLRTAQAQLIQTSRLAALGELVAGVAHELNNPLGIILGNAELMEESAANGDDQAVANIIHSARRAQRIVQSLLAFARQSTIEKDWYTPSDLLEQVLDLKRASIRAKGITLRVEYPQELPLFWVDGPEIQQVLLNLLLNAEYALSKRADPQIVIRIFVSTVPIGAPPILPEIQPCEENVSNAQVVVIDIADNGSGLAPEVADRLFQPFVTTKPMGEGSGLGLAISYGIVVQHGGNLQVSSKLEHGTTFRVTLPIQPEQSLAASLYDTLPSATDR